MPDDNKTTDTNPTPTQDASGVGQTIPPMEPSISSPSPLPVSPTDQGQITDTPPPAANSTVPPPPPIIEEQKEGEADIPPVVTTGEKPKGKVGKKVIATILGILFLVGGVSAGVILVQQQQEIREKASCVSDGNCIGPGEVCCNDSKFDSSCYVTETRCESKPAPEPTATPTPWTPSPQCKTDGNCIGPGEDCCSGNDYFDNSCPVTETRCGVESYCSQAKQEECTNGMDCIPTQYGGYCEEVPCRESGCLRPGERCCGGTAGSEFDASCYVTETMCGAGGATATPVPTATPTPRPGVEISARCLNIKAFDTSWDEIIDLSSLKAGDIIRFTVSGTTNSGNIDKARFRINSPTWRTDVVAKKPGTGEFYDEYTIPEGVTSFTINTQLHHTSSDISWF